MKSLHTLYLVTTFLLSLVLVVFQSGCNKSDDNPTGLPGVGSSSRLIGPLSGGSVLYEWGDESAMVSIPLEAVNDSVLISVGIPSDPPSFSQPDTLVQVCPTYEFLPEGQVFNDPVTVTFGYANSDIAPHDESTLRIMTYVGDGDIPDLIDGIEVDTLNNTIHGTVDHFSYFILEVSQ